MEKDTGSGSKSACRSWDAGWMHGAAAVAYGAEMEGGLSVAQDAAWTDLQKFQAVISVRQMGWRHLRGKMKTRNMKWR